MGFYRAAAHVLIQKNGVCIGSCIAPALNDLFLAHLYRKIHDSLDKTKVLKVFRYVGDYLLILDCPHHDFGAPAEQAIALFSEHLQPLVVTSELPHGAHIRFLDLNLHFANNHICWAYTPRAKKPLLPFGSAHSKLVKKAIASLCVKNALAKSCPHSMTASLTQQAERLSKSGYPSHLVSVAEKVLKEAKLSARGLVSPSVAVYSTRNQKVAVIPYIQRFSHNLKRIAKRAGADVAISAPNKLSKLCRQVNGAKKERSGCKTEHQNRFVACTEGVVQKSVHWPDRPMY